MRNYQKYEFRGPVIDKFSRVICRSWHATTYAASAAKARSNLSYQFKKTFGLAFNTTIYLSGEFVPNRSRYSV